MITRGSSFGAAFSDWSVSLNTSGVSMCVCIRLRFAKASCPWVENREVSVSINDAGSDCCYDRAQSLCWTASSRRSVNNDHGDVHV